MRLFYKYWLKYKIPFILSVLCVTLEALCDLLVPKIMGSLIDNGVNAMDMNYILTSGACMLGVTLLGAVFACTRNIISSKVSQKVGAEMREDLFVKIQRLSVSDAEKFDGGSLITRMTNDVTQLTNFINGIMRIFFKAPVTCIGSIVLAATINIRTVPIVLGIVIVAFTAIFLSMKFSYPAYAKIQTSIDKMNTTVREYLMGIRLVKAFGRYKFEKERFKAVNKNLSESSITANKIGAFFSPIAGLAANLGIAVIILLGSRWVGTGDMRVGEVMAFVTYMSQILFSMMMITNILNVFVRTKASSSRVNEIMDLPDSEDFEKITETKMDENGTVIQFENVTFQYPLATGENALQNLNFTVNRGETIGIIGPTGSGKSTITSLLLKFYNASSGKINIKGTDINSIPPAELRKFISIAPQDPMLFAGSIKNNICFGNNDAAEDDIIKAAKTAEAYDFIASLNDGFETQLEQGGVNLSGGQKQRLSIARAIAGNPEILIFDDCTSALDAITEAKVQKNLKQYSKNLTCIMISQRISAVMNSDKILVLENGYQIGFGTHQELLKSCKIYHDICKIQLG